VLVWAEQITCQLHQNHQKLTHDIEALRTTMEEDKTRYLAQLQTAEQQLVEAKLVHEQYVNTASSLKQEWEDKCLSERDTAQNSATLALVDLQKAQATIEEMTKKQMLTLEQLQKAEGTLAQKTAAMVQLQNQLQRHVQQQEQLDEMARQRDAVSKTLHELQDDHQTLRQQLTLNVQQQDQQSLALQSELRQREKIIQELKVKLQGTELQSEEAKQQFARQIEHFEAFKQQIDKLLTTSYSDVKEKQEQLLKQERQFHDRFTEAMTRENAKRNELQMQIGQLQIQCERSTNECTHLRQQIEEAAQTNQSLRQLKEQHDTLQITLAQKSALIDRLQFDLRERKEELSKSQATIIHLEKMCTTAELRTRAVTATFHPSSSPSSASSSSSVGTGDWF
jgi:chromosome segregation ATPase